MMFYGGGGSLSIGVGPPSFIYSLTWVESPFTIPLVALFIYYSSLTLCHFVSLCGQKFGKWSSSSKNVIDRRLTDRRVVHLSFVCERTLKLLTDTWEVAPKKSQFLHSLFCSFLEEAKKKEHHYVKVNDLKIYPFAISFPSPLTPLPPPPFQLWYMSW